VVLVVDDGSQDETAHLARASGATVLSIPKNQGKGWALRSGFKDLLQEPWEGIITLDGDLQHDPVEIPKLIEEYDKTKPDIVIGSRMAEAEKIPGIRYWTNRVGVFCISWAAGQPLADTQSGFRLYCREVLESIPLWTSRYDTETEILIKAGMRGMKITCVPIKTIYYEDELHHSSFRPFPDTFLICMVFLKSLFWRRGWYLRNFEI
jgi:glycosyltransferase involved in cell wall biosynthesis